MKNHTQAENRAGSDLLTSASDDVQICNCYCVAKSEIIQAIEAGESAIDKISEETYAGLGCGGCRFKIESLIQAYSIQKLDV